MKVLVDIGHPAHVHLFKNVAFIMSENGHSFHFTVRQGESESELLSYYKFNYSLLGNKRKTKFGKLTGIIFFSLKIISISIRFRPDIFLSHGSVYAGIAAYLLRKPHIALEDSGNMEQIRLSKPVSSVILAPKILPLDLGKKHISYDSYHELAYLHPKYFDPDIKVIQKYGLIEKNYCLLRFSAWKASHDIGQSGFTLDQKLELVNELIKDFKVLISSEDELPDQLAQYRSNIHPKDIHHILAFARMVISEGATIASESGILGVPSIYVNSIIRCYNEDQSNYNTVYNFRSGEGVIEKVRQIIRDENYSILAVQGSNRLVAEKIDLTALLIWFIETYPESKNKMIKDPDFSNNFR